MAVNDFAILSNLAFYHDYKPTYFYFNSLINYRRDPNAYTNPDMANLYNERAEGVAADGIANLTKGFLDISQTEDKNSLAVVRLEGILTILKRAIVYERKNEVAYFKQKYTELEKTFNNASATDELKILQSIMNIKKLFKNAEKNPTDFDYSEFLVLINTLLTDLKTTKAVTSYELERLQEVEDAMQKIRQVHYNRLVGLTKKMGEYNRMINAPTAKGAAFVQRGVERFDRKIEHQYISSARLSTDNTNRKYQISGVKRYLEPIRSTVDVVVAHWITDQIQAILNNPQVVERLESAIKFFYIIQKNDSFGWRAVEANMKEFLIKVFLDYGARHIPEIISDAYDKIDLTELVNHLQDSFSSAYDFRITNFRKNFGQIGLSLDLFDNATTIEDLKDNDATQLFEAMSRLYERLNKYKKNSKTFPLTDAQKRFIKVGKLTSDDSEYKEMMRMIRQLDDMLVRYEKAVARNEHLTKTITSRNRRIKNKNGQSDIAFTLHIVNGEVTNLDEIKEQIIETAGYTKINKTALTATSFKTLIRGLKVRASYKIKDSIIKALENEQVKGRSITPLMKLYQDGLQGMTVSITGPSFQELRDNIFHTNEQGVITNMFPDKINRKNDTVVMIVKLNEKEIAAHIAATAQDEAANTITNHLNNNYNTIAENYNGGFTEYFMRELEKLNNSQALEHNSPSKNAEIFFNWYRTQAEGLDKANDLMNKFNTPIRDAEAALRAQGKSEEEIKAARIDILNSLKNTFFISSTMKTRNQYQNDLGFSGGSIGQNLTEQLLNIADIFEEAGAPLGDDEIDWLYSAIINCSPYSVVGERNKDTIQNYLGALAAFLLFDEGGAELQIIDNLEAEIQDAAMTNSPSILHLYNVNGLYVPGSVVLERTWQDLNECLTQCKLASKLKNHGASVTIYNPMKETGIPNRGTNGMIVDQHPWETIGARADEQVEIKIMFLGGLLDILNSMNNKMLGVELPSK